MRYDSITDVIGDTPLVRIAPEVHGLEHIDLFAKLEMLNPLGSVKDRAAWAMAAPHLDRATADGATIVELSSGNTAKALAVIAGMHQLPFRSITNRMKVPEIKDLLLLLGARIDELPGQAECLDPTDTEDPLTRMYRTVSASADTTLHTDQYFNPRNTQSHVTGTGPEIIKDLDGHAPEHFIAAVGTAGSSTGVAQALRACDERVSVTGIVAHKSDFIPGIRTIDEVHEVGLFDPDTYDRIESVTSGEAIEGMLVLMRRCGILSGPTGGAAYFGAVRRLRTIDDELRTASASGLPVRRHSAVLIICDRVESYLSYVRARRPDLFNRPEHAHSVRTVTDEEAGRARVLDIPSARRWLAEAQPLVIDLRGPFAYATAHIEGSINIIDGLFDEMLHGGLPFPTTRPVLLACPVGERSRRYAALLTRMGHPDAVSLDGGIVAWRDAGAPLARRPTRKDTA
jgi:cysteine synthase/rhodanese-related sulfurtransferase